MNVKHARNVDFARGVVDDRERKGANDVNEVFIEEKNDMTRSVESHLGHNGGR